MKILINSLEINSSNITIILSSRVIFLFYRANRISFFYGTNFNFENQHIVYI